MVSAIEEQRLLLEAVLPVLGLVFGLAIGSFLNVVIHRLPRGESIVFPASHCPGCDEPIRPVDNIPVLSYILLRGRCRACGMHISARYPAVELLTGVVFALIAWRFGAAGITPILMVFAAALIVAALIDFDTQIIPDEISLGGLIVGLIAVPLAWAAAGTPFSEALTESALGAVVGGGTLWVVAFVHARVSVALGRHFDHWPGEGEPLPRPGSLDYWCWFPGLGFGDVKLMAMIGAFLGLWGVLGTIVVGSAVGLVMGLATALVTRRWVTPFGFAPAIAVGALLMLFLPASSSLFLFF